MGEAVTVQFVEWGVAGVTPCGESSPSALHLEASFLVWPAHLLSMLKNVYQKNNMHREMVTANMG